MESKLPFGSKNGELVEIAQVERGLECGCVCPACGSPLVARKGPKTTHHFAHYTSIECVGALETAVHLAAKQVLEKHKKIKLPPVITRLGIGWDPNGWLYELYKERVINFDNVYIEQKLDNIKPDVILEVNGVRLLVEIAVTHFINDEKREKIKKLNISTIEIDLRDFKEGPPVTFEELERVLLEWGSGRKNWIHNVKAEFFLNKIKALGLEIPVERHEQVASVNNCYKRKHELVRSYAILNSDCFQCSFCADYKKNELEKSESIICIAEAAQQIEQITSKYRRF